MVITLAILNKASGPYWNMLKRRLGEDGIAPLTITHIPNLIGHPFGLAILAAFGMFVLPSDPVFYLCWTLMIAIAAVMNIFAIIGLLEAKFFTTQVIGSLGFVSGCICAVIFLGESINVWAICSICLAVVGVVLFSWKKRDHTDVFAFDRGTIFTIIAVLLSGFTAVRYKVATRHAGSYGALFSGRFVSDLIAWTIAWLVSLAVIRRNPLKDAGNVLRKEYGLLYVFGMILMTAVDS